MNQFLDVNKLITKTLKRYIQNLKFLTKQSKTKTKKIKKKKQQQNKTKQNKTKQKQQQQQTYKTYFGILKIRHGILLYSKNFFQLFKIRGGRWRTTRQPFFRPYYVTVLRLAKWVTL